MTRAPNWSDLLLAFVESRQNRPFQWGVNDCCLFASDWVLKASDVDLAASFRGSYSSALGASRLLRNHGGVRGLIRELGESQGMQPISSAYVQRGDLVVADTGYGEAIGISLGNVAAFVARDGLVFAPFDFQLRAPCWRF
jgi:hypothetical protein